MERIRKKIHLGKRSIGWIWQTRRQRSRLGRQFGRPFTTPSRLFRLLIHLHILLLRRNLIDPPQSSSELPCWNRNFLPFRTIHHGSRILLQLSALHCPTERSSSCFPTGHWSARPSSLPHQNCPFESVLTGQGRWWRRRTTPFPDLTFSLQIVMVVVVVVVLPRHCLEKRRSTQKPKWNL